MGRAKVTVSKSAGFCWGVERALETTMKAAEEAPEPVNTLGPLIHNPSVIADLKNRGVGVLSEPSDASSGTVILRSHGVPKEIRQELLRSRLTVIDATCPFVTAA